MATTATDPDPGDDVTVLSNGLRALTGRLDDVEDATATALETMSATIQAIQRKLIDLAPKKNAEDAVPASWAARASEQEWIVLIEWVDWLNASYSIVAGFELLPCWPAHPGVVEEVAALHRSWARAMIADTQAGAEGSADAAAWHDRWLWPTLRRLKEGHYRIANCTENHHPERITRRPTDRTSLPG